MWAVSEEHNQARNSNELKFRFNIVLICLTRMLYNFGKAPGSNEIKNKQKFTDSIFMNLFMGDLQATDKTSEKIAQKDQKI
jgi:hypothetical protein